MQNSNRVELPIVPLLDVSFQLMFFLVITFQVGGPEGQFALSLPSGGSTGSGIAPAAGSANVGVDLPSSLVVSVRTEADQRVHLIVRDGERIMEMGDSRELTEHLAKLKVEPAVDRSSLRVEADGKIKYSRLIEVLDACKRAGFENISFAMPGES
jgi:biopolymer transport protein ExbD